MSVRSIGCAFIVAGIIASAAAVRAQSGEPGRCPGDSKLLNGGPTLVLGDGSGTWWGLVMDGLVAAGFVDESEQLAYLNQVFGTAFATLEDVKAYNLQLVEDVWDKNHNGYVCAFELRGTRAYYDNPYVNLTFFGISDDKVGK